MKNSKFQTMEFISTFIPSLSPWCACVCACGCACVCTLVYHPWRREESVRSPGGEITDCCHPPCVIAGNCTPVFPVSSL